MNGQPSDAAVVDIGSNSVRLVIYRLEGRAIWTTYNEKVLAGLGRDLAATRRLAPSGVAQALLALRRFRAVLEGAGVTTIFAAATAAVREAIDGPAFVEKVRDQAGFRVRVLSGPEEARYAALGVIAGQPDARGVVGDLGGSSLELVRIERDALGGNLPGEGVTLPLGPFAMGVKASGFDVEAARRFVASKLAPVAARFQTPRFNAVGGAWRNLALMQMRLSGYPLRIVHEYEMGAADTLEICRLAARQSRGSLDRIEGMSKKRADTLPHAALVLEGLIEHLGVERVAITAYGLREGLIYESLAPSARAQDPLIAGCQALGERQGMAGALGGALEDWLAPLWAALPPPFTPERSRVLLAAACRLADVGARLHPDHRADLAYEQVLRAPIAGQTHVERAFLACAVHARYASSTSAQAGDDLGRVISPERLKRARVLGAAMRLGCDVSGRSGPLLRASSLTLEGATVVLTARAAQADLLLGEQTTKRLATLAEVLGMQPQVRTA